MFPVITSFCENCIATFDQLTEERKAILHTIAHHIVDLRKTNEEISIISVCTHNSRRSHFAQVAIALATNYYKLSGIKAFSAGTEATAVHPNTLAALEKIGFLVETKNPTVSNPVYQIYFDENKFTLNFSKTISDPSLPTANFLAIMTCSDAAENCPYIPGALHRIATPYSDPKLFDHSPIAVNKYTKKMLEISTEWCYIMQLVSKNSTNS